MSEGKTVVINGVKSQWGAVKSGVPQGSVLGPILFLIYVSDISDDVSSNVILFADDTKLYSRVERQEDCHTLQEDINKLVNWSEKWLMRVQHRKMQSSTLWTQQHTTALFYERFKIINNKRRERFRSFDY